MFSRLDSLFSSQIRHAEKLDTRQAVRRHEDQPGRRREHDRAPEDDPRDGEDRTSVSVRALRAFLEQLVADAAGPPPPAAPQAPRETTPQTEQASRAAQAYEKTQRTTGADRAQAAPAAAAMPSIELTAEEIRIIHALIADLGRLAARNVEQLPLSKSSSFLQSLVDAVAAAGQEF